MNFKKEPNQTRRGRKPCRLLAVSFFPSPPPPIAMLFADVSNCMVQLVSNHRDFTTFGFSAYDLITLKPLSRKLVQKF